MLVYVDGKESIGSFELSDDSHTVALKIGGNEAVFKFTDLQVALNGLVLVANEKTRAKQSEEQAKREAAKQEGLI